MKKFLAGLMLMTSAAMGNDMLMSRINGFLEHTNNWRVFVAGPVTNADGRYVALPFSQSCRIDSIGILTTNSVTNGITQVYVQQGAYTGKSWFTWSGNLNLTNVAISTSTRQYILGGDAIVLTNSCTNGLFYFIDFTVDR